LEGYEQGVNAMVRMGIFSPEMVIDIERNLLDPQRINLTTESFSGWSYSQIVFPERRAGIQIAPQHLKIQERLIKGYMESAGLVGKLSSSQLRSLAIASAIMHEYGHTVDYYLKNF
jgi:hypothetical protein